MRALYPTKRMFGRIASVLALACFLNLSVSAYTVVMRGGRRVELPTRFVVTATTLTYEVSPGIQVTLEIQTIDIPATEKANNELPGSLLRRVAEEPRLSSDQYKLPPVQAATRTITNRDLESSMRRRSQSELAYERRRKELGLPSVEESRRREAAESALIAGELVETRAAKQESESYWRARASALRTEIVSIDAQLGYIRRQLDESSSLTTNSSFGVISVAPSFAFGNPDRRGGFGGPVGQPNIFVAPRGGTQVAGRIAFGGGTTRGQVWLGERRFYRSFGNVSPWLVRAPVTYFDPSWQGYGVSDERNVLVSRFHELAAARAGLNARWRELEDEARRAGAPPGWLRQ